ncbi:MAG: hypothetical protein IPN01_07245 [Deltaproteobacteria bacterium]|nr:hypothetical protein [Deltaproteobacteria bacterium]
MDVLKQPGRVQGAVDAVEPEVVEHDEADERGRGAEQAPRAELLGEPRQATGVQGADHEALGGPDGEHGEGVEQLMAELGAVEGPPTPVNAPPGEALRPPAPGEQKHEADDGDKAEALPEEGGEEEGDPVRHRLGLLDEGGTAASRRRDGMGYTHDL